MAEEREIGDHVDDLQSKLQELAPAQARMDTAQTLYLAGQQSVRPHRFPAFWPLTSACLAVVCITLGALVVRPTEPRIVYDPTGASPSDDSVIDEQHKDVQPDAKSQQESPMRTPRAELVTSPNSDADWRELASRLQRQKQLLDDPLGSRTSDASSGEPAVIEAVAYSDWPVLLTDQSVGERFQTLSKPFRSPSNSTIQYLSWPAATTKW